MEELAKTYSYQCFSDNSSYAKIVRKDGNPSSSKFQNSCSCGRVWTRQGHNQGVFPEAETQSAHPVGHVGASRDKTNTQRKERKREAALCAGKTKCIRTRPCDQNQSHQEKQKSRIRPKRDRLATVRVPSGTKKRNNKKNKHTS